MPQSQINMLSWLVVNRKTWNVFWSALAHEKHQHNPVLLNPGIFLLIFILPQSILPLCSQERAKRRPSPSLIHTVQTPLSGQTLYLSRVPLGVLELTEPWVEHSSTDLPAHQQALKGAWEARSALGYFCWNVEGVVAMLIPTTSGRQANCAFLAMLIFPESGEKFTSPKENSLKSIPLRSDVFVVCEYVRRKRPEKKFKLEYITVKKR